jgi:FlgD Ig-like domain
LEGESDLDCGSDDPAINLGEIQMTTIRNKTVFKPGFVLFGALVILSLAAGMAQAWSGGPPNGRTNAPGETTCTACHSTFPLNSGTGSLSVSGVSESYVPNQPYDLIVQLQDPDASRWGFEFTVIDDDGVEIGSLASLDANTQIGATATRSYGKQTSAGTQIGTTGAATWTMRWTAPDAGSGPAYFYLAGNAANGNFSSSGDRIYTISETWTENTISPVPSHSMVAELKANYPNPFNPRTTIAFELASSQSVRLSVYSLDGRLVRHLADGVRGEGSHEVLWDGLDNRGSAVPSGTYFYRLQAGSVDQTRSMVLVR